MLPGKLDVCNLLLSILKYLYLAKTKTNNILSKSYWLFAYLVLSSAPGFFNYRWLNLMTLEFSCHLPKPS